MTGMGDTPKILQWAILLMCRAEFMENGESGDRNRGDSILNRIARVVPRERVVVK